MQLPTFDSLRTRADLHLVGLIFPRGDVGVMLGFYERQKMRRKDYDRAAAMFLVEATGLSVLIRENWRGKEWFTEQVDDLARNLHEFMVEERAS